jgi:ERCC4-related helicase
MPDKVLTKIKPREYQQKIYENCIDKNCLVILPTGIGKTLIALMLTINRSKRFPGSKVLFLAPTRPLAEQHFLYFKKHLPELFGELSLFTGKIDAKKRKDLWERSDIIFSTPQCTRNDLIKGLYDLSDVSLLIEDECHRCLKNYAYTLVVKKYYEQAKNPRVLGLTASPGTDKQKIIEIAKNLGIEKIEIRTRESEDVKEYLQKLEFKIIKLDFPIELREITEELKKIYRKKVEELKNRKLLFRPPTKTNILELQKSLMGMISRGNKNFNLLSGVSVCSQAIKLSHLIELLETQTIESSITYIKSLFIQANENKSKAVKQITKNKEFNSSYIKLLELYSKGVENPKVDEVKKIITSSIKNNPKNKTIIFTQYRDTAIKICKELDSIPNITPRIFIGQAKKLGSGLSQKEQQQILEEFRIGSINCIVSTSIGEEGLDIPEVNSVIFYEPIPSAIRKIQRTGRTARLMKGNLIILMNKETLDQAYYFASLGKEKKMHKAIDDVKEDLDRGYVLDLTKKTEQNKDKEKQKTLFENPI